MSSTAIKLLALVLMLCDHIHAFIPGAPLFLTWLGRLAAPLFVFCVIWSLHYTHDRKKYMLRLYLFGILMGAGDLLISLLVGHEPVRVALTQNIFTTLLLIGIVVSLIELFLQKKWLPAIVGTVAFVAVQFFICLPIGMAASFGTMLTPEQVAQAVHLPLGIAKVFTMYGSAGLVDGLLPGLMTNEGGIFLVLFGTALYFCRNRRALVAVCFVGLGAVLWVLTGRPTTVQALFFESYDWLALAGLPFALAFNGKRGKGYKYLFYIFYPAHIWLLYIIGNLMG